MQVRFEIAAHSAQAYKYAAHRYYKQKEVVQEKSLENFSLTGNPKGPVQRISPLPTFSGQTGRAQNL